ncbi:hypothetical protein N7494_002683 [Penicillium frequentans]|uniref:Zn(2)-C6 fungal-type domain-containing protein n=1 Tax=Penicillium frequentans TaxID=3151616 RepID=A0AAD6D4A8_9EURO|nr:hypothetical protein N7494_002683 [Penicillium glabrum]
MPAAEGSKSSKVCANCKARKKRCDKSLPRCRYCADRDLPCLYQTSNHGPRHRLIADSGLASTASPQRPLASTHLLFDRLPSSPHIPRCVPTSTIESALCVQAQRLLDTTGLYLDEISARYFQGIHTFVPIISRRRFHTELLSFGTDPKADFTLLVICMALLIYSADSDRPEPQGEHRVEDLTHYVATKSLMAQAQALCAPTTHLIQAGVLLAVYEYAHGHPEQAFVTIGSYARMAYAARLRSISSLTRTTTPRTDWTVEEESNIWWGIRICERTFLCELANVDQPLGSVTTRDCCLPLEPAILDQKDPGAMPTSAVAVHDLASPLVGGFGRNAQAAWLLDGVLQGLSMVDTDQKVAHLIECDRSLQSFLAIVMQQHGGKFGIFCTPIALTIRALFLLHWHLLEQLPQDPPGAYDLSNSSHQALDSVTKMVIDITSTHELLPSSQIDQLPPSCLYIIRAALKHIHDYQSSTPDPQLQTSLKQFEARWGVSPSGLSGHDGRW